MMATLDKVSDYVTASRVLLQDTVAPYRYPDADLVLALSMGILDARRLRPDLFINVTTLPFFTANDGTLVAIDQQYRNAFVYYMTGMAQLRDDEDTQDARAAAFMGKFTAELVGLSA